ncbi:MAG: low molecular weight protein-tyrosine-phosphatase [Aquisalimonadaceae bacterium]
MVKVLFVCMGNICRSPTAEGVFRNMVREQKLEQEVEIDSAGTHAYHIGHPPDTRAQAAATARGFDISDLRARQVIVSDFEYFDWILCMDESNLSILQADCPPSHRHKLHLFLNFAPNLEVAEVPDPYYGHGDGFRYVLGLIEEASAGLLNVIREKQISR